jgi:hypothetical protein
MIARLIILVVLLATPLRAEDAARLVYIGTADDPYYEPDPLYTGLSPKPFGNLIPHTPLRFCWTCHLKRWQK